MKANLGLEATFDFRTQEVWGVHHAAEFFFFGTGGSLFLMSLVIEIFVEVLLLALISVLIGGTILISDLGRKEKFVRALLNAKHSWIARGAISVFVFIIAGSLSIAPQILHKITQGGVVLPWYGIGNAIDPFRFVAALSGAMLMIYPGLVLFSIESIPFWNILLLPLQFFFLSVSSSVAVVFLFPLSKRIPAEVLSSIGIYSLVLVFVIMLLHIYAGHLGHPSSQEAVRRLVEGKQASLFYTSLLVGLLIPLATLLAMYYATPSGPLFAPLAGAMILLGGFLYRYSILKVGVYAHRM